MSNEHNGAAAKQSDPAVQEVCDHIQEVLFDYMARELGEKQSLLVREHLRHCPTCRAQASDIQQTLNLLNRSRDLTSIVEQLSDKHRKHLFWAYAHPFLERLAHWHVWVSLFLTALALAITLLAAHRIRLHIDMPRSIGRVRVLRQLPTEDANVIQDDQNDGATSAP